MYQIQQPTPDSTVRPIQPTYLSKFLDDLPAYSTCEGRDIDLDLSRLLWESDNYYPYLVPFPTNIVGTGLGTGAGNILNFNAGETQTGSVQISTGAYLVHGSLYVNGSSNTASKTGAGAKLRVYDKATQSDLFYQQFGMGKSVLGDMSGDTGQAGALYPNTPFGPHFFTSPFIISAPGILQWEITNLDPNNGATIQCLLAFAVPKGSISGNVVVQEKS